MEQREDAFAQHVYVMTLTSDSVFPISKCLKLKCRRVFVHENESMHIFFFKFNPLVIRSFV